MEQTIRYAHTREELLCSLHVFHNYFENGLAPCIRLKPTKETAQLMAKAGFRFLPNNYGGSIVYQGKGELPSYLRDRDWGKDKLSFLLFCEDPYFFNYTELPIQDRLERFHFDNLIDKNARYKSHLLHKKLHVSGDNLLNIKPMVFLYQYEGEASYNNYQLINSRGEVLHQWVPTTDRPLPTKIDLRNEGPGQYQIVGDGVYSLLKFYATNANHQQFAGVVDLYLSELMLGATATEEGQRQKQFAVCFAARKTTWKYYFIYKERLEQDYVDHQVMTRNINIPFTAPKLVKLANGGWAQIMTSSKPIPLSEIPVDDFHLQMEDTSKSQAVRLDLPTPSVHRIKAEARDVQGTVYSEIFVYV